MRNSGIKLIKSSLLRSNRKLDACSLAIGDKANIIRFGKKRSYSSNQFDLKLETIIQQLNALVPRFPMSGREIEIIKEPSAFYDVLKKKILSAQSNIFLSSLYIGRHQNELVDCISDALRNNKNIRVSVLIDFFRGTREAPNNQCSASLLSPLVREFGKHRVNVRLYHTPHLSGLLEKIAPKRINEGWGLQHTKIFGFDDEVILSGANLSQDYFTNRQDRYYLFKNGSLSNYYFRIHESISSISYQLHFSFKNRKGFYIDWPVSNKTCEPHLNFERFINDSSYLLEPVLKQQELSSLEEFADNSAFDTIVYPISQLTPLFKRDNDCSTEKPVILRLLSYLDLNSIKWWFTAGYFNMLPEFKTKLLESKASGTVITAAPEANSFYRSPGLSKYIPEVYLLSLKKFLQDVWKKGKNDSISVYEWKRGVVNTVDGWSYHSKGLWISAPEEEEPSMTVVGSSNYTERAYLSDLECNALIITKEPSLKKSMSLELENFMKYSRQLDLNGFERKAQKGEGEERKETTSIENGNRESRHISWVAHLFFMFFHKKF